MVIFWTIYATIGVCLFLVVQIIAASAPRKFDFTDFVNELIFLGVLWWLGVALIVWSVTRKPSPK